MRRIVFFLLLALMCALLCGTALADYGYTDTSLIPMAVDFSFSIEFDAQGNPQIVTDYPFEKTGARQLNVVYNKGDIEEAVTLVYEYPSGKTRINGWNGDLYRDGASFERTIYGEIRSGVLTPADSIYLNTVRNSAETDWVLEYSVSQQRYLSYEEKTHSQGFNAMAAGGISKSLYYWADELDSSRVMIRTDNADLLIDRNRTGDITYASVYQYAPTFEFFDYDPSTGLFGERSLSDLGFNESDIEVEPLAMIGGRTDHVTTSVSVADDLPVTAVKQPSVATIVCGLLTGILIGLTLFNMFRRRKDRPEKPVPAGETENKDEIPAPEETFESTTGYMRN